MCGLKLILLQDQAYLPPVIKMHKSSDPSRPRVADLKKSSDSSSSSKGSYQDDRYLFVKSGLLSAEQLEQIFRSTVFPEVEKNAKKEAEEYLRENPELKTGQSSILEVEERKKRRSYYAEIAKFGVPTNATFNVVSFTKKLGFEKYMGYGSVFLSNVAMANAIRGRNLDGSERVRLIKKPEAESELDFSQPPSGRSWADDVYDEFESISLSPLVRLPFVPYTAEILQYLKGIQKPVTSQLEELQLEGLQITVDFVKVKEPEDNVDTHAVWSRCDVPKSITKEQIAAKFAPYVSQRGLQKVHVDRENVDVEVPHVVFKEIPDKKLGRNIRTVIVYFSKYDRTVPLILYMTRHFEIGGFELIFGHPPLNISQRK